MTLFSTQACIGPCIAAYSVPHLESLVNKDMSPLPHCFRLEDTGCITSGKPRPQSRSHFPLCTVGPRGHSASLRNLRACGLQNTTVLPCTANPESAHGRTRCHGLSTDFIRPASLQPRLCPSPSWLPQVLPHSGPRNTTTAGTGGSCPAWDQYSCSQVIILLSGKDVFSTCEDAVRQT